MGKSWPFLTFISLLFLVYINSLTCVYPPDPYFNDKNVKISISPEDTTIYSTTELINFQVRIRLPHLVTYAVVDWNDGTYDTIQIHDSDSVCAISHKFFSDGEKTIFPTAQTSSTLINGTPFKVVLTEPVKINMDKKISLSDKPEKGNQVTLSVSASGTHPITYQWFKDKSALFDSDSSIYFIDSFLPSDNGNYFCIVSNILGSDTSQTINVCLEDNNPPTILNNRKILSQGSLEIDSSIILYVETSIISDLTFQWYKNNEIIPDNYNDSLNFKKLNLENNGKYFCIVENEFGKDTSDIFSVDLETAPIILNNKQMKTKGTVHRDSTFSLFVEYTSNTTTTTFEWYKNGAVLEKTDSDSIKFEPLKAADSGSYHCIVHNSKGSDTSKIFKISFEQRYFKISIHSQTGGSISPLPKNHIVEVLEGESVLFLIAPDEGHRVKEVLIDGVNNSDAVLNQQYEFVFLNKDHTIEAVFEVDSFNIDINISGEGKVDIDPSIEGKFPFGEKVILKADTIFGNRFTGWTGDISEKADSVEITVIKDFSITANFVPVDEFSITHIIISGEGIIKKLPQKESYYEGESVVLKAIPSTGYTFNEKWSVNSSDTTGDSLVITVSKDFLVTVSFNRKQYTITTNSSEGGTIIPSDEINVLHGNDTTISIIPNPGYKISEVEIDGILDENAAYTDLLKFENVTSNHTIKVSFLLKEFSVKTEIITDFDGIDDEITKRPDKLSYDSGSVITLYAPENERFTFSGWNNSDNTDSINIIISCDTIIKAYYEIKKYNLSLFSDPDNGGDVSISPENNQLIYNHGTVVKLTAEPQNFFSFSKWSGDLDGNSSTDSIIMDNNKTITAHFSSGHILSKPAVLEDFNDLYEDDPIQTTVGAVYGLTTESAAYKGGGYWYVYHDLDGSSVTNFEGVSVSLSNTSTINQEGELVVNLSTSESELEYPYAAVGFNLVGNTQDSLSLDLSGMSALSLRIKGEGHCRLVLKTGDFDGENWGYYGFDIDLPADWDTLTIDSADLLPETGHEAHINGWTFSHGADEVYEIEFRVTNGDNALLYVDDIVAKGLKYEDLNF